MFKSGCLMTQYTKEVSRCAVDIICAYVANNTLQPAELTGLIAEVHGALARLAAGERVTAQAQPATPAPLTAAQIRKSITPDYIICFENGRSYRSLTRHLRAAYDLSPAEYRLKWGLPPDYPMVAPNYAAMRSDLARKIGLGAGRPGQ